MSYGNAKDAAALANARLKQQQSDSATALALLRKLVEYAGPVDIADDGGVVIDAFVYVDEAEADLLRRVTTQGGS